MNKEKLFLDRVNDADCITITTHLFPDADGIGSQISLCMALRLFGKQAVCLNEEPLLERYRYLDPDHVVWGVDETARQPLKKKQLLIVVDTNSTKRIGTKMETFAQDYQQILYIDHHPCSDQIKQQHCIDTSAAATGELVGRYIKAMGLKFNKKLALPIYTSILIDTSSFRYPSVSGNTHRLIGELLDTGLQPPEAYNGIYGTKHIQHMHLLSSILSTSNTNQTAEIAWIILHKEILDKFSTDIEDTHGFINNLLILDNIKVACMFREDPDEIKISFRSTGHHDVGHIARKLGGGGHSHSAATLWQRKPDQTLDDIVKDVIQQIESIMKNQP